ncbi:MAG: hypothetical protein KatS3mg126_2217 [Lysobacteraceae bacterium]|nr:MAG: hypothetical protein KatS3mg126_2217 [Xanthomonadaceae bacterium]
MPHSSPALASCRLDPARQGRIEAGLGVLLALLAAIAVACSGLPLPLGGALWLSAAWSLGRALRGPRPAWVGLEEGAVTLHWEDGGASQRCLEVRKWGPWRLVRLAPVQGRPPVARILASASSAEMRRRLGRLCAGLGSAPRASV